MRPAAVLLPVAGLDPGDALGQDLLEAEHLLARVLAGERGGVRHQLVHRLPLPVAGRRGQRAVAALLRAGSEGHGVHPQRGEEGRGAEAEEQLHDVELAGGGGELQRGLGADLVISLHAALHTRTCSTGQVLVVLES